MNDGSGNKWVPFLFRQHFSMFYFKNFTALTKRNWADTLRKQNWNKNLTQEGGTQRYIIYNWWGVSTNDRILTTSSHTLEREKLKLKTSISHKSCFYLLEKSVCLTNFCSNFFEHVNFVYNCDNFDRRYCMKEMSSGLISEWTCNLK